MNATEYQKLAARTLIDAPDFEISSMQMMILWNALGLAGEAGEVAEAVKKGILHQHGLDLEKMKKELGDAQWYLTALCTVLGFDLSDVMAANIEKLKLRYPDGFKSEDSIARVDIESQPYFVIETWKTLPSDYKWLVVNRNGDLWASKSKEKPEPIDGAERPSDGGWFAQDAYWLKLGTVIGGLASCLMHLSDWSQMCWQRPEVQK